MRISTTPGSPATSTLASLFSRGGFARAGLASVVGHRLAALALAMLVVLALGACGGEPQQVAASEDDDDDARLVARAAALELDTEYTPPPGEPLHHHTAGFAKILCSAVFITGLDPADAAEHVGGFTSPFDERHHVVDVSLHDPLESVAQSEYVDPLQPRPDGGGRDHAV